MFSLLGCFRKLVFTDPLRKLVYVSFNDILFQNILNHVCMLSFVSLLSALCRPNVHSHQAPSVQEILQAKVLGVVSRPPPGFFHLRDQWHCGFLPKSPALAGMFLLVPLEAISNVTLPQNAVNKATCVWERY